MPPRPARAIHLQVPTNGAGPCTPADSDRGLPLRFAGAGLIWRDRLPFLPWADELLAGGSRPAALLLFYSLLNYRPLNEMAPGCLAVGPGRGRLGAQMELTTPMQAGWCIGDGPAEWACFASELEGCWRLQLESEVGLNRPGQNVWKKFRPTRRCFGGLNHRSRPRARR